MIVIWQDVLLMVGGFGFSIALLPAVLSKKKPCKATSLTTACILTSFTIVYASLYLVLACISTGITAVMWFILFFQARGTVDSFLYKHKEVNGRY